MTTRRRWLRLALASALVSNALVVLAGATSCRARRKPIRASRSVWCCPMRRAASSTTSAARWRRIWARRSGSRWSPRTARAPAASPAPTRSARSAPDGYTLVLMDPAIVINPTLQAEHAVRPVQEPADRLDRQLLAARCWWSRRSLPVKTIAELDRLRQGQSGQAQFRLGRHRHDAASRRRNVQAAHRHRRDPRALHAASARPTPT